MAQPIAVTNTTPIIALVGIGELRLLDALFERVVVPFAVWDELTDKPDALEPATLRALRSVVFLPAPPPPVEAASLDAGEAAAIALALAIPDSVLLLDELTGRKVAVALGLPVRGTLGLLIDAKAQGLVPAVGPLVQKMVANGIRLAPDLVTAVLSSVGEI